MSKIIAVDFDKTIGFKQRDGSFEVPQFAVIYLRKWRRKGHKVILWTCRQGEALEQAKAVCKQHGMEFDAFNENINADKLINQYGYDCRKLKYDYIIDDKCLLPVFEQFKLLNEVLGG